MVQVVLKEHEPEWAVLFVQARTQIEAARGRNAIMVEHVGSTSIPDICAKPIIDMLLVVPDSTLESDYLEALELAGFSFHLREPIGMSIASLSEKSRP